MFLFILSLILIGVKILHDLLKKDISDIPKILGISKILELITTVNDSTKIELFANI